MTFIRRSSLVEIAKSLHSGELTLTDYVNQYCDRFEQIEPEILAFVPEDDVRGRLLKEASQLMVQYPISQDRPPLYGILVGIKDIIHANGFLTRAGSNLPPEALTGSEAAIVTKLRNAGALIAGKTTTEEFAYASLTPTRNPHNLEHTPGGSSAGSAAAVAAGLCPLAVGTQTLRSVIAPASFSGVVGFKPSYDRIPVDGTIVLSRSIDTVGFFTQDVQSMELACSSIIPEWNSQTETKLNKPRLGIPNGIYMTMLYEGTYDIFERQIEALKLQGYIVRKVDMPWDDSFIYGDSMLRLIQAEMAEAHTKWYPHYKKLYSHGLSNVIESGQKISRKELHSYCKGQIPLRHSLEQSMVEQGIDLWVSPAQAGSAPKRFGETGRSGMTSIWTYAGIPTITIPGATLNNMPLGFQCMGTYGKDEALLTWASEIETVLCENGLFS